MKYKKESIFLSLVLRHKPEAIDLKLDEYGWLNVKEVLSGMKKKGYEIDNVILEEIVEDDEKQRYTLDKERGLIRANQGHSIPVNLLLTGKEPPEFLYHGTSEKALDDILRSGILRMKRQYVHLSKDVETARLVGRRHGNPIVIKVSALEFFNDGGKFYLSENKVWLSDDVPVKYLVKQLAWQKVKY